MDWLSVKLVLVTGGFVAGYSLVDRVGARLAGTALEIYGWLAIGNAVVMLFAAPRLRPGLVGDVFRSGKAVYSW